MYLDDVLVFGFTMEEHNEQLVIVLEALSGEGLTLNLNKCLFALNSVKFLGYVVNEHGLRLSSDKMKEIRDHPNPTCLTEL